jgi:tensin
MTPTGDDKIERTMSDNDDVEEDTDTTTKPSKQPSTSTSTNASTTTTTSPNPNAPHRLNLDKEKLFKNFQAGWSSVVETTKRTIDETKKAVETNQIKLEQGITQTLQFRKKGFYKRDPNLPLDVQALRDAQVVYITDRIITMSHPAMPSTVNPTITGERKLAAIGHLLQRRHDGRFLVWNLSEIEYDIDILDDQVLTFSFPGSPSPPLEQLLKLLVSMENWMKADDRNVAVVHCLTGKGRTSTVLAAFLCWMGQAGFGDIQQALEYIAHCKQMTVPDLIIPSQARYASYFKNMLDGVRPSPPPLLLKRIIMSEAPKVSTL